ncbi:MAG TPA: hypothetical protein VEZ71_02115 [Archangium sp.]|nr:hypothetical protein [Archangium sp.]
MKRWWPQQLPGVERDGRWQSPRALELARKTRRFFQKHQQQWLLARNSAWMATHSIW